MFGVSQLQVAGQWAYHGPGLGPFFDSIVERFITAMGSSEPQVREWPKFLRVRVSGDLNYTKVLTGNAAERSAGCIPLDYRPAPEVEAIPGPTVVGEKYLLARERSLQLEREWAEAKLIVEGEYPTPPSYVNARIVPTQSLQVAGVQTELEVPSTMGWTSRRSRSRARGGGTIWPSPKSGIDTNLNELA